MTEVADGEEDGMDNEEEGGDLLDELLDNCNEENFIKKQRDDRLKAEAAELARLQDMGEGDLHSLNRSEYSKEIRKRNAELFGQLEFLLSSCGPEVGTDARLLAFREQVEGLNPRNTKSSCVEPVTIGILGDTGAGKSSCINAILGEKGEDLSFLKYSCVFTYFPSPLQVFSPPLGCKHVLVQ